MVGRCAGALRKNALVFPKINLGRGSWGTFPEMHVGRVVRLITLYLLLCINGCGPSAAARHPSERAWVLVTTEHFRVYSDLDGQEVVEIALDLERDLGVIAQATFRSPLLTVEPTDVVVFSERAHFHRYFSQSLGGAFFRSLPLLPESNHTVVTYDGISETMQSTLRHELVHDVYARNFGAMPPWLNEGFAEYFSTVKVVEGKIHIGAALADMGTTNELHPFAVEEEGSVVLALPRRMIPPPSALLRMTAEEFYGPQHVASGAGEASLEMSARYYGAWAFVQYLMGPNGDYSQRFQRFLNIVRQTSVAHAWQQAFAGVDMHRLDEEFRSYLAVGRLTVSALPYRPPGAAPSPQVRVLSKGDKHVILAKLALATSGSPSDIQIFSQELDAALQADPPSPEAYYLRGMFAWSKGNAQEATRAFERALALTPDDPRMVRAALELDLQQLGDELDEQELASLRPGIDKLESLARGPSELLFLARFFSVAGDKQRALALGERAVKQNPVDPRVLAEYARVLEWCGHLQSAISVQRRALEFLNEHREVHERLQQDLARMESQLAQQGLPSGPS